jgi:eukaryotic-like serine/threonine-protein kinase
MSPQAPSFDTIFCAAIEIESPSERTALIGQLCGGDAELKKRIEKLVAAHFQAGRFLEDPAAGRAGTWDFGATDDGTDFDLTPDGPATQIGPYKLLEQIGEGGFGVVYLAEQTEPLRRKVALKILKLGMDTRQVVARFQAERQALNCFRRRVAQPPTLNRLRSAAHFANPKLALFFFS